MNKKTIFGLWVILFLEFLFIFIFFLNYDLAWMVMASAAVLGGGAIYLVSQRNGNGQVAAEIPAEG